MSAKKISIEGLRQLSQNAALKKDYLKSKTQSSLIEYRSITLVQNSQHLFQFIIWAFENNTIDGPIFNAILAKTQQSFNSLLGYCFQSRDLLKSQVFITISHQQAYSQALLLALFLGKQNQTKIDLVLLEKSLKGIGSLIADQNEVDKLGFTKIAAAKEGILLHNFDSWEPQSWINQDSIILIDLFGLNPIEYRPFLLHNLLGMKKAKKLLIYHSHLQDQEIFNLLEQTKIHVDWLPLQLWPQNPLEAIVEKDEQAMLQRLFAFLKEESTQPEKQDAVIFFPVDTYVKRFTGKLNEQLSKHQLKGNVNFIFKPHQSKSRTKNNIFLVSNTTQLADWDYDYSNLFYAIDYETDSNHLYEYALGAYVRSITRCSGTEKAKRMAVVGSTRIGRYVCLSANLGSNLHYTQTASQLSSYVIRMISLGLGSFLQNNKRVKECLSLLETLEIISLQQTGHTIKDKNVLEAVKVGANPIQAKYVFDILQRNDLQLQQKIRLANLMIMVLQVLRCAQNMHNSKVGAEMMSNQQWDSLWKTSGYLQSCIVILTHCNNLDIELSKMAEGETSQLENFKRISSKISQDNENSLFGSLFQLCQVNQPKKTATIPDYLKHQLVNEEVFYDVRHRVDNLRQLLGLKPCQIIFEMQDLEKLFKMVIEKMPYTIASYTGYKRLGYKYQKQSIIAQLHKQNLHAKSKEHPEYLFVFGLQKKEEQYQIMYANAITAESVLSITGHLPVKSNQSLGQTQLQFHGISSSIFEQLLQKNEYLITNFQNEFSCIVEANQELALFLIYTQKQRSAEIKKAFETLLSKTRQRIAYVRKTITYLGHTKMVMAPGGQIDDIIKSKDIIDKCLVNNLHLDVTKADLDELFQQFFHLKDLVLNEPQPGANQKSAFVKFYSQKDYQRFQQSFQGVEYFGLQMKITPIKSDGKKQCKIKNKLYIQFVWFVWQSHGKALVRYVTQASALKAQRALLKNPKIDGAEVVLSRQQNSLFLENLNVYTDEIYLQQALKGYGQILQIEVLKSPIRQIPNPDNQLEKLIKKVENYNPANPFEFQPVEKRANGLRRCRVNFISQPYNFTDRVVAELDKKINVFGSARLYANLFIEMPLLVPNGLTSLYLQILDEYIDQVLFNPQVTTKVCKHKHLQYLILKGQNRNFLSLVYNNLISCAKPVALNLSKVEKNILFTDIALSNIMYIEQKYHCKIIIDIFKKEVSYISTKRVGKQIKNQIRERMSNNFFYMLRLNAKTYKHFKTNPKQLQGLKEKFKLHTLALEAHSYSILINGSVNTVEQAVSYLMHFIESLVKPEQLRVNSDLCGVCCDPFKKPYRLQRCSHMFCTDCLKGCLQAVLQDINLFPLKCPHCLQLLTLRDIELNFNPNEWQKLKTIGINKFVGLHSQKMRFCYTIGCKQINILDGPEWKCQTCNITYCNLCKETYHPGIKCEDVLVVRQSDEFFKKYLSENGGRLCPNPGCKMPVVKIDGCNKVQCTRCLKSMCFKCSAEEMIPYDTPTDCYDHLNKVHGGYY